MTWQLDGTQARVRCGDLTAQVDLEYPSWGVCQIKYQGKSVAGAQILRVIPSDGETDRRELPSDCHVRGTDLIASYGETERHQSLWAGTLAIRRNPASRQRPAPRLRKRVAGVRNIPPRTRGHRRVCGDRDTPRRACGSHTRRERRRRVVSTGRANVVVLRNGPSRRFRPVNNRHSRKPAG
jgi:hypothetical protein